MNLDATLCLCLSMASTKQYLSSNFEKQNCIWCLLYVAFL